MRRELGMSIALVLMCLGLFISNSDFLGQSNGINTLRQISMLGIYAIGIAFVIITGGIDLSIGSTIGLTGVLALFLGLLKIAEQAGIVYALVKVVQPVLRPLFPEIPPGHPALGLIALNLAANVFGLGNAATPFGIKAMESMQTLNHSKDTATNSMVMLLAINTASVQLVPPVLLLALLGLQINRLIFPILISTILSLIVAIVAAKLFGRLRTFRDSDPNLLPPASAAAPNS